MSNPDKTIYELRETIAELSERCREQEADIEELLKEREWISPDEKQPNDGEDGIGTYLENFKSWLINGETGWHGLRVIAWMPLPEKPESEDDAE